jgi:hypothetical protein
MKKKSLNTDKIIQGIKTPGGFQPNEAAFSKINNLSAGNSQQPPPKSN